MIGTGESRRIEDIQTNTSRRVIRARRRPEPVQDETDKEDDEQIDFQTRQAEASERLFHELFHSKTSVKLLALIVVYRCLNALFIQTHFDPDETWQSLEVAHTYVFGYGHLTWEWTERIRGFAHPLPFAMLYKALQILGLDKTDLFILLPKLFQGILAGLTDFYTFMLATRLFGLNAGKWTVIIMMLSWFNAYCLVRTYSNSMETLFTVIGLFYWPTSSLIPKYASRDRTRKALFFAAWGCLIRPTNLIIWSFLFLSYISNYPEKALVTLSDAINIGLTSFSVNLAIDFAFYKSLTLPTLEFFRVNVVENISLFYGGHPSHWYFTQGLPVVLFSALPLCTYGITRAKPSQTHYAWMCLWTISILSLLAHKEFRFLLVLVPVLIIYAGHGMSLLEDQEFKDKLLGLYKIQWTHYIVLMLGFTNCVMVLYLGRVHQSGVIQVMHWLRGQVDASKVNDVLILMPCHSTPYYSYLHRNVSMRFVSCEPPIKKRKVRFYKSETEMLYSSPPAFFKNYFDSQIGNKTLANPVYKDIIDRPVFGQTFTIPVFKWASHIVVFDNDFIIPSLKSLLDGSNYKEVS